MGQHRDSRGSGRGRARLAKPPAVALRPPPVSVGAPDPPARLVFSLAAGEYAGVGAG